MARDWEQWKRDQLKEIKEELFEAREILDVPDYPEEEIEDQENTTPWPVAVFQILVGLVIGIVFAMFWNGITSGVQLSRGENAELRRVLSDSNRR